MRLIKDIINGDFNISYLFNSWADGKLTINCKGVSYPEQNIKDGSIVIILDPIK